MLPPLLTASPAGAHPPDEMPARLENLLVCSTWPAVLIWATPPGSPAANCGTETQNEPPTTPFCVVCGFHAGCSKPPAGICPGIRIPLLGVGGELENPV